MPDPKVNILLVDDHPENLLALEAVLGDLGQNLVKAGSGSEALKHLLHEEFAVILLDVQMPELDGFETAALIRSREKTRHTPLIFLTAINKSDTHVSRGYSTGAVDYVFKPFVPETLRSKVATFVELSRKTKELQAEVVQRRRAEEEVRKLNEELERRVSERTAELFAANRELENEIAERKQLEAALQQRAEELAEADRRKDEFLAMLAHELRNPLAPIRNAVKVLQLAEGAAEESPAGRAGAHGTGGGSVQARARSVVERQVQHMSRLVDDLLDVSRITRGIIQLCPEALDLGSLTARAVETVCPAVEARQHQLTLVLPEEPLWLEADPVRLEQVLANLLSNAIKYTDPEGQIWVTVERSVDREQWAVDSQVMGTPPWPTLPDLTTIYDPLPTAVLRVRDTGIGISQGVLPRIFDLFAQADRSLDRARGGLGLGLTLVRRLVELHGGTVTAFSDGPGRGSEFVVRLPIGKGVGGRVSGVGSDLSLPTPYPLHPSSSPVRVLVVDDNVDAAEMLAELTELWGCEARVVHDGPAAIEAAISYRPEVVLLDIGLPGMDGFEVARRLREHDGLRGALIVAVTGYGQEEDRRRSREANFDYHLTKPVDPEGLKHLVAGAMEGRSVST